MYRLDIKHQMWEDSAQAVTWLALPEHGRIITKVEKKRGKDPALLWPKDSVLARTVSLPTIIQGKHYDYARVETQVLHFDGSVWNAYTYQWRADQKDGDLVPAQGGYAKVPMTNWADRKSETIVERRLHSRAECMRCHNSWTGGPLSITPAQLDTEVVTGDPPPMRRQIDDLVSLGLIDSEFVNASSVVLNQRGSPEVFMLNPDAAKTDPASVNERARSYLHVNCSQCHRKNAGGAVTMMLNAELPAEEMRALDVVPQQGGLGLANPKLIDPGNPWNSVICVRLAKTGIGHMPVIGPRGVDEHGLRQVEEWIAQMGAEMKSASDLLPQEWSESLLREKLATVEGAMQVRRAVADNLLKNPLRQSALEIAWKSPQPTVRDIFDRFKPDDLREATIGPDPDVPKLLAMPGDVKRGASVLSLQGKLAACYACHLINGTGLDFGPDLSKVGARLKREQILESMLHPSKAITQGYAAVSAEMKDGVVQSGFIVKDGAHDITLKTATGQSVTLMKSDIKSRTTLPASLMPEGQLQSLTSQETADVLTYLESLK